MPEAEHRSLRRSWDLAAWLYNAALLALSPLLVGWLGYRMLVQGKSREGLAERLGHVPARLRGLGKQGEPVVWFHAVSVGEVAAAVPIMHEFHCREPLARLVLSTTTPTGRRLAEQQEVELEGLFYFPFDLPHVVRRVLDALQPKLLVLVEGELWPNLLAAAGRRGVRVCVVNGRISDRAFRCARLVRPLYRWMLGKVDLLCAQSALDAERFVALGAPPERVQVLGNTKFDERFPEVSAAEAAHLRLELGFGEDDPVLVGGSTHQGEERVLLEAFSHLRVAYPRLQLVLAPRHPERGDEVHELVEEFGFQVYRRSHALAGQPQPQPAGPQARVVILDTIGELARVYGLAGVVFVGGSLVRKGGHNILQPLAQGKPVLTGPHMHNFRAVFEVAREAGVVEVVRNAEELARATEALLRSPEEVERRRARALAMLAAQRGAAARIAQALTALLDTAPLPA
jgi:3-deoxy-D-manno-octulosonic-acid transferase